MRQRLQTTTPTDATDHHVDASAIVRQNFANGMCISDIALDDDKSLLERVIRHLSFSELSPQLLGRSSKCNGTEAVLESFGKTGACAASCSSEEGDGLDWHVAMKNNERMCVLAHLPLSLLIEKSQIPL